jgi:hypothetical protein
MPNALVSAAGAAMPAEGHKSRRAALGLFASLPALVAIPAIARASSPSLASADEAELFALQAEIADMRAGPRASDSRAGSPAPTLRDA